MNRIIRIIVLKYGFLYSYGRCLSTVIASAAKISLPEWVGSGLSAMSTGVKCLTTKLPCTLHPPAGGKKIYHTPDTTYSCLNIVNTMTERT
jgi:hypothetical protein